MIYIHLQHAAGVTKALSMFDINVLKARANDTGAQLFVDSAIPFELSEHIESESELGHFIFGVWVKQEKSDNEQL